MRSLARGCGLAQSVDGVTSSYQYDNLSRLLSVLHKLSAATIDGASYAVDAVGNRTAKRDKQSNLTSTYTYDPPVPTDTRGPGVDSNRDGGIAEISWVTTLVTN